MTSLTQAAPSSPLPPLPPTPAVDDPLELDRFTRWEAAAGTGAAGDAADGAGARIGVSSLQLSGMYCAACAGIIEQALEREPGVLEARVSAAAQRATVRWDAGRTRASRLIEAVQAVGYGAVPDAAAPAREARRREHRAAVWRLFVGSFLAMQVMMLATPSYVAPAGDLEPDLAMLLNWGQWVLSIPVMWFGGMPFIQGAWHALRARRIAMDVPVALGITVAFVASTLVTFSPGGWLGHEVYFDSLTMFIAFLWLGRWLELRARHRAAEALETALAGMPAAALRVCDDGAVEEVAIARLRPGDRVRVPVGGAIPADGILLSDAAGVGEALLTGESRPVPKARGDAVLAGSLNVASPLEMRVERVGADTRQEAIVAMMREALSQRPEAARLADRVAGPFLWAVLLLAAGAGLVWLQIQPERALWITVAVLIVTCPCALSLAMPATLVAAAGGLARRGVLLRRLDTLEAFTQVRRVFVDKTGTLTTDKPALAGITLLGPIDGRSPEGPEAEIRALAQAAALARWSTHPLSRAIVEAAEQRHSEGLAPTFTQVREQPGQGMSAVDAEQRSWRLGAAAWTHGAVGDEDGVFLVCDGEPVARFVFAESLRPQAAEVVAGLRAQGVDVTMLSGDSEERAHALAGRVGIDDVVARASPQDKLEALRQARARQPGAVAMVGDGINDAPVLAAADVSLAMGHGALATQHSADAIIVSGRLDALLALRRVSFRTMGIVRQNLAWAAAYNAACIPLAMVGWLPPWAAGLGMAMSSVAVIANARRAASLPR